MAPRDGGEVAAPRVQTSRPADRPRRRLLHRRRVDLPLPAQPRLRHVRRRHDLVPHALRRRGSPRKRRSSTCTSPIPLRLAAWFYPQSSELVHAAGIVVFKTDWLSPLINLIWLAIALLAAWCVGRPYKVGPATLVAAAIVLDAGVMIETQPGEGRNDIMGLAFLIAFAAFLINGHQRRAPDGGRRPGHARSATRRCSTRARWSSPAIAAGLAASVKLTFLVPVVAIWLGVVVFSGQGRRLTTAWVLGLSDLRRRRLLVRAGGDQDRRQPDPADRLRPAAPAAARPDAARPAAALRRLPLPDRPDDLPALVLPPPRRRLRPALAADPDRRRRRRGLHRGALAQPDPAGDRRGGAADRRSSTSSRRSPRPGRRARRRASSPTPATWCRAWSWR